MDREKIQHLAKEAISENSDLFLVDLKISADNSIEVWVDSDQSLPLDEIVRISRYIEHHLDRDEEDFSLRVSSPGVGNPLLLSRQYKKNMGRMLRVNCEDGTEIEGKLVAADDEGIVLKWTAREPKPTGKGKRTVEKEATIKYKEIKKSIVKITF